MSCSCILPCREGRGCSQRRSVSPCREGRSRSQRSRSSPCREGRGCTLRRGFSACREGRGCTPNSRFSACRAGKGRTSRSYASACREGMGCSPHSRVSACREDKGYSPCIFVSPSRASIASLPWFARHDAPRAVACVRPKVVVVVFFVVSQCEIAQRSSLQSPLQRRPPRKVITFLYVLSIKRASAFAQPSLHTPRDSTERTRCPPTKAPPCSARACKARGPCMTGSKLRVRELPSRTHSTDDLAHESTSFSPSQPHHRRSFPDPTLTLINPTVHPPK